MRTLLICHADDPLTRESMARWLASFSELAGIVLVEERRSRLRQRVRREIRRVGQWRFLDVLAWRIYERVALRDRNRAYEAAELARIRNRFPPIPDNTPALRTHSPNSPAVRSFMREHQPDVVIARCKTLLKKEIFDIPRHGTWVMHPGICPEYRNAHGCFWALANDDLDRVGMTLLKVDEGIDTGPVYGHFTCRIDHVHDTPAMINHRVVIENLPALQERLQQFVEGKARPVDTQGRASAEWGQPWLSRYLHWKWRAHKRMKAVGLCYHDVVDDADPDKSGFAGASAASYKMPAENMLAHLEALASARAQSPARVDELEVEDFRERPLLLTYDDGGSSALEIADMLDVRGWKGHFLITAGRIDSPGFVSAEQIRELHARGHVIGSHSWSHPERMSVCDDTTLRHEWQRSVDRLSEIIGEPVRVASVPGGFHSQRVAEAAAAAGIQYLFTSEPIKRTQRVGNCLVFGRYAIHRRTSPGQAVALGSGELTALQAWQYLYWNGKKLLKKIGGNAWLAAREAWWRRAAARSEKRAANK